MTAEAFDFAVENYFSVMEDVNEVPTRTRFRSADRGSFMAERPALPPSVWYRAVFERPSPRSHLGTLVHALPAFMSADQYACAAATTEC